MKGFVADIEELTEKNRDFRRVLYTGKQIQLVLMSLLEDRDQFFRIEKGEGEVWIDGNRSMIKSDDAIVVPAGARHNIANTGEKPLRLYTLYAPPEHRDGSRHKGGVGGFGRALRWQDFRMTALVVQPRACWRTGQKEPQGRPRS